MLKGITPAYGGGISYHQLLKATPHKKVAKIEKNMI